MPWRPNHEAELSSSRNCPTGSIFLRGNLPSWCRLYGLRFAVQEVIHHDDVMGPIVIRPRRSIAARDAHSRDTRVRKDNAEEGETRVPRRGRDKAAEDQPSVGAETLDARTGLAVPVFIAGSASVRKVDVGKDSPETTYFCRDSSIGARHEEQGLGDVAVHWSEQPLRAKGAEDAAVRRIVEKRSQAALRPTRRGCLRETRSRCGELSAPRVQKGIERRDWCRRRIDAAAVPVDLSATVGLRPAVAIVISFQGDPVLFDRVLNRGDVWPSSLEHGWRHEISAGILCASEPVIAAISTAH